MRKLALPRWIQLPGLKASAFLFAALLAVNAVSIWGMLAARQNARKLALADLELETTVYARSLEAALATMRGDFIFLSQSPALRRFLTSFDSPDPMLRRWARLDVEGTLLLFFEAHPPLVRLVVAGADGSAHVLVGRRGGVAELLPGEERLLPPGAGEWWLEGVWPLGTVGGAGWIEVWVDPEALLGMVAPGLLDRLSIERSPPPSVRVNDRLLVDIPVVDDSWLPRIEWWLVRSEDGSELIRSVEALAQRYRTTLIVNLAVMALTLALGMVAFRQVRRAARLEAEAEQQARVRDLERQLLHSERLASVGRLAAGMAHEINNPLEGMANYLSLVEDDLTHGDLTAAGESIGKVREGLDRAAGITRQVLAFSDPGKAPKSELDLLPLLHETVDFVRSNPAFANVEVAIEPPSEASIHVLGNATTLGQLFLNLILNACQAQPGGGRVEVTMRRGGDQVQIRVADHGPGLGEKTLTHLFEPFYSGRGSTGLGLAVCHGIVAEHGGDIQARNRQGGGAVFEVVLPALSRGSQASEDAAKLDLGELR